MNTDKHGFYKINLCANAPGKCRRAAPPFGCRSRYVPGAFARVHLCPEKRVAVFMKPSTWLVANALEGLTEVHVSHEELMGVS
jgi:hypothetical protein